MDGETVPLCESAPGMISLRSSPNLISEMAYTNGSASPLCTICFVVVWLDADGLCWHRLSILFFIALNCFQIGIVLQWCDRRRRNGENRRIALAHFGVYSLTRAPPFLSLTTQLETMRRTRCAKLYWISWKKSENKKTKRNLFICASGYALDENAPVELASPPSCRRRSKYELTKNRT